MQGHKQSSMVRQGPQALLCDQVGSQTVTQSWAVLQLPCDKLKLAELCCKVKSLARLSVHIGFPAVG